MPSWAEQPMPLSEVVSIVCQGISSIPSLENSALKKKKKKRRRVHADANANAIAYAYADADANAGNKRKGKSKEAQQLPSMLR